MAKKISSLSISLGATVKPFVSAFAGVRATLTGFTSSVKSSAITLLKFTGIAGAIGGVVAAFGGLKSAVGLSASLEQTSVAFETLLGSADAAGKMMGELKQFAASTPFEFPELASSARSLVAFGVAADQVQPSLKAIGDISAGVGATIGEIATLFGKAKTAGTLYAEDINQLVGRGIPVIQEFAKQLGVSESEVKKMASEGKINFGHLQQAFADLSGEGGKFQNMMAKQSTTLAGLWSTLSDNIGMTLADIATTIINAFNIKGAISSMAGAIGSIGATLNGFVTTYAPVIVGWASTVYNAIVGAWTAVYGAVAPIVIGIANYIASTWASVYSTTASILTTVWGYVSSVWQSIYGVVSGIVGGLVTAQQKHWRSILETVTRTGTAIAGLVSTVWGGVVTLVTTVANAVASAWTWAMDLLGISTVSAGDTTAGVAGMMANVWQGLQAAVTYAINVITFALENFGTIALQILTGISYEVVRFGNQIVYFFGSVIPDLLSWFGGNWRQIFTDVMNFTAAVFTNLATNAGNFFAGLWSLLKGDGFNFQWTGLTEGFESTLKELPKIAEREIGGLEQSLADQSAGLSAALSQSWNEMRSGQAAQAKGIADGMVNAVAGVGGGLANSIAAAGVPVPEIIVPTIDSPAIEPATMKIDADTSALKKVKDTAKEARDELTMLTSGTAAAQLARYQAAMSERAGGTIGGEPAPAPKAAPVPATAQRDMRKESTDMVDLTKQVLALLGISNASLQTIANKTNNTPALATASF